uniref:Uncharacterized protein n=1 Tax=uncultured prokaryote TaxID=198431 RepID=A0A0H5QH65_9ZZZZ|nr:hypothetical protein [uncultured prokaryote]
MTYLAQASIPYYTGNARDVVTNTFHVDWGGGSAPIEADYANLTNAIAGFYEYIFNDTEARLDMAPWMVPALFRVVVYDLDDIPPRAAVSDTITPLTVDQATSSGLPPEVAIVLSYRAAYTAPGVPRARQRGRIYIGGLASGINPGSSSSFPVVTTGTRAFIGVAAEELIDNLALNDWTWVVYSRAGGGDTYPIVAGWVDGEPDTQRRRGRVNEDVRTPWPAA